MGSSPTDGFEQKRVYALGRAHSPEIEINPKKIKKGLRKKVLTVVGCYKTNESSGAC
jgi:hypothetical protein